jgi:hypothetical protein
MRTSNKQSKRHYEPVSGGWDSYFLVALKIVNKWWRGYFPTKEDMVQTAALAATVARVAFGEETIMGKLSPVLRHEISQEAGRYGWRQRRVYREDKSFTMVQVWPETAISRLNEENPHWFEELGVYPRAVGVGQWTRVHARLLDFR